MTKLPAYATHRNALRRQNDQAIPLRFAMQNSLRARHSLGAKRHRIRRILNVAAGVYSPARRSEGSPDGKLTIWIVCLRSRRPGAENQF